MNDRLVRIEIQDGELEEILEELNTAQEKIYECYDRLQSMGVVTVRKAADVYVGGREHKG